MAEDFLNKITPIMVRSLDYGESIMLDEQHELYHYSEDDIIVVNRVYEDDEDENDEELYQVLIGEEDELIFEKLYE